MSLLYKHNAKIQKVAFCWYYVQVVLPTHTVNPRGFITKFQKLTGYHVIATSLCG